MPPSANPLPLQTVTSRTYVVDALKAILEAVPALDPARVFLLDISAGGFMAERVACEAPEGTFSAIGIYAGSKSARSAPCTPPRPLPYLYLQPKCATDVTLVSITVYRWSFSLS